MPPPRSPSAISLPGVNGDRRWRWYVGTAVLGDGGPGGLFVFFYGEGVVPKPFVEGYPVVRGLQGEGVGRDRPGRSGVGPAEGCLFSLKERGLPRLGFPLVEIPDRGRG